MEAKALIVWVQLLKKKLIGTGAIFVGIGIILFLVNGYIVERGAEKLSRVFYKSREAHPQVVPKTALERELLLAYEEQHQEYVNLYRQLAGQSGASKAVTFVCVGVFSLVLGLGLQRRLKRCDVGSLDAEHRTATSGEKS